MCSCCTDDRVKRLERAGFAVHRCAQDLRDMRERWPAQDELAKRLQAVEEECRTLAGQVAMAIRDHEEADMYADRGAA